MIHIAIIKNLRNTEKKLKYKNPFSHEVFLKKKSIQDKFIKKINKK